MFNFLGSILSEPESGATSGGPTRVVDHHGALDIPEIVRQIIVFVLSNGPQPRLLHWSSLFDKTVKQKDVASSSSWPWLLRPLLHPPSKSPPQGDHSNDSSSVRLVSRLWYASWRSVRLVHHTWTIDSAEFNFDTALEAIQARPGRQRIVIEREFISKFDDINALSYMELATVLLASHQSKLELERDWWVRKLGYEFQLSDAYARTLQLETALTNREQNAMVESHLEMVAVMKEHLERQLHDSQHSDGERAVTASASVVRELCLQRLPPQLPDWTFDQILYCYLFRNLTMLEISFLQDTEFDVKSLFVQDHAKATYLALYFPGLRHLLFRRIQPKPISPELLESSPAPRCLATLVLDGVVGTVPDLRDLIRLFRSPMLRRVHVLRPMDRTIQDTDMNHSSHEHPMLPEAARVLALNPNQSMYDIFDELLQSQYRYHHDNSSSSQAPPLLPPPYASLCLEFRDEGAYLRSFDQDRVGAGPTYDLSTNHSVLRDLLAEERLANYLESDQCRHLYELYMPSTAFDVKPFINSFSSHVMLRESGTKNVQGQQGSSSTGPLADAQPTTMSSSLLQRPVQHQWQCRNLQRLTLSFLTSSNAESINVQSYRELFGFLSFNCPQIQELDLQTQGMLLTWDSGLCLTSRWRHLRHLVLRGCSLGCESLATAVALRKRYRKPGYIGSRESKDLEWVAKQPRKLHVQHRRTSRAMCREVLCLPPFSKMQQRHQQLYGAMSQSSTETDLMCMDYGSHVHLGHDRHTYEPGSLAAALESTLELQPRHRQRKQRLETIDDLDIFSHKNLDMLDLSMLDLKEGALWESLQSVHFVTENLTHTIARRPKSIWDDFIQSWRDLLPGTEVKFAFGQDTPELQRFN